MQIYVVYSDEEISRPDFRKVSMIMDSYLDSFKAFIESISGVLHEEKKKEACNKGVCQQRRNKTVRRC